MRVETRAGFFLLTDGATFFAFIFKYIWVRVDFDSCKTFSHDLGLLVTKIMVNIYNVQCKQSVKVGSDGNTAVNLFFY